MKVRRTTELKLGYVGKMSNTVTYSDKDIVKAFIRNIPDENVEVNFTLNHRIVNVDNYQFYIFEDEDDLLVFKKMPLVVSDELFNWTEKHFKKGWRLSSYIRANGLGFSCEYDEITDRCTIEARLQNNCSIHLKTLYVDDATNETILEAIDDYRNSLIDSITKDEPIVKRNIKSTGIYKAS